METISILGCGWYGKALAKSLLTQGYHVKGSTTSEAKMADLRDAGIEAFKLKLDEHFNLETRPDFFGCDILVICSNSKMDGLIYLSALDKLCFALQDFGVSKVIFVSSISVYGDSNSVVDEMSHPIPDKASGMILIKAETMFINCPYITACIIRFGGLVGPGRMPGRFFSAKKNVPDGMAPVNMIHLEDCIGITNCIIKAGVPEMTINAVSPDHPERSDFYLKAALAEGLIAPTFVPELKSWKQVNSIYVSSYFNYQFKVSNWSEWLERTNRNK
ncbi:NAD(P)H-binding protein [Taibaiella lutea]|uniref:NAD(P)H-binding protein n=1 Tax=Taibaiella lutea TaxID=2608001 RepID=A0A5M6CSY2_9BACT|nr:NAD(P)H-binding protein [Taibaiella lutea]KAA5536145.1 NAD(P)H-binding protein [Taibaiella lutea]